jgi:hypothetical protein
LIPGIAPERGDEREEGFPKAREAESKFRRKENPNARKPNPKIFLPRIKSFQWVKPGIRETADLSTSA